MEKLLSNNEAKPVIPYNKAARVGNYKVWRTKGSISVMPTDEDRKKVRESSGGRQRAVGKTIQMEFLNISNLDCSWSVKIPATLPMYATICDGFAIANEKARDNYLCTLFANFLNVTTSTMQPFQDGVYLLSEMMTFPYLFLPEDEMVKRMKDYMKKRGFKKEEIKSQIDHMVEYRRGIYGLIEKKKAEFIEYYEAQRELAKNGEEAAQEALRQDELAEKAIDIINEKDEGVVSGSK